MAMCVLPEPGRVTRYVQLRPLRLLLHVLDVQINTFLIHLHCSVTISSSSTRGAHLFQRSLKRAEGLGRAGLHYNKTLPVELVMHTNTTTPPHIVHGKR